MPDHDEELCAALTRIALAGDGVVLGIGMAVVAVKTWMKFRSHSTALKQLQETPVTRIADLRSLVKGKDENSYKDSAKLTTDARVVATSNKDLILAKLNPKQVAREEPKLMIVRGRVYPRTTVQCSTGMTGDAEALMSQNGNEKGVLLERTQTYMHTEMNSLLGWITQKDLITLTRQMVRSCQSSNPCSFCPVSVFCVGCFQCLYNEWRGIFGWGCEWKGLLGYGSFKEQVTISRRKVPFVIAGNEAHRESSNSQVYVHIQLDDPPRHPLPLVTVYHKLHPVPASSYTFVQAMLGKRYPVGLLDEEKIIPIGKEITAVGLISTAPDGNPIMHACKHLPCFLSESTREQLVTELATGTRVLMWTGIAVSTLAAGILCYAFMKNWTKWKARQLERQRRDEETRQDRILVEYELEDITDVPDGELCVVCLLRRRRAAFIYCGHRVCCVSCAQRVEQGANARCPVCRRSVTGYVRVFDS